MHRGHQTVVGKLCATAAILLCSIALASAQTTAFTYQGKLTDAGSPANGNYDLQFRLFDVVTSGAGVQQGVTLVRTPVAASAGVFTVTLDFGASVFDGTDRYLDIGVRPAGSAAAYTMLAPRQPVTASPYAIQTLNSLQLGGLPASSFIQNTATPQAGATFNIGGKGTAGSVDVNGSLTQVGSAAPPVSPIGQSRMYFDAATNKVKVSENGSAFVNLVGATGVSGSGVTGTVPLFSAGTTLGNSLITQSGPSILMPNSVVMAIGAQGYQVSLGSPNGETGLTIAGPASPGRMDLRFDGTTAKLVAGPAGSPPFQQNGIAINTTGSVMIGTPAPPVGKLSVVATGATPAIYGESSNSRGVWGKSTGASRGVVGESVGGEGVLGISGANYGVSGVSTGGSGVFGATSVGNATQAGVFGQSNTTGGVGVIGQGTTGVYGLATTPAGVGVTGQSDVGNGIGLYGTTASSTGYGVFANNPAGIALGVAGNATQNRDRGGLVKAMVQIAYSGEIPTLVRCYNGQTGASTGNCGFTYDHYMQSLFYLHTTIDFGFRVDDRFMSLTAIGGLAAAATNVFGFPSTNSVDIRNETGFYLIVY